MTLPAVAALGSIAERLEVVGTMPFVELARGRGLAEAVHSIDRAWFRSLFADGVDDTELVSLLGRFDLVVAWAHLPLLAGKLHRLGVRLIEATPHPPDGVHASDHLIRSLESLGIHGPAAPPTVEPSAVAPDLGLGTGSFLAIHPSSGSRSKNWPAERFLELARLARGAGLEILWIQGDADADIVPGLAREVAAPVAQQLPLRDLAALLARSAVFVGNDSGVSHLAAAAGAPTLALFGATDPRVWAPRGRLVHVHSSWASAEQVWGFARELIEAR